MIKIVALLLVVSAVPSIQQKCNYDDVKWPVTCEWKNVAFDWKCPAGYKIRANAFYGRKPGDNSTCIASVPSSYLQDLDCPGSDVYVSRVIEEWCNEKAVNGRCKIRATNRKLGGDPCMGTFKYLKVCTYCERETCDYTDHENWPVTCEWKTRSHPWQCPEGYKVRAKAAWARPAGDNDTCVEKVPYSFLQKLDCPGNDAKASKAIEDLCTAEAKDGVCTIKATNKKLGGDPCVGTFKYLQLCTYCEPDDEPKTSCDYNCNSQWPLTCEWKYKTIDWICPDGYKARANAFWGRDAGDNSTCVDQVPSEFLQELDCPGDDAKASKAVEEWCNANAVNGKCKIRAANTIVGGDPCVSTFKYLKLCNYCEREE